MNILFFTNEYAHPDLPAAGGYFQPLGLPVIYSGDGAAGSCGCAGRLNRGEWCQQYAGICWPGGLSSAV